MAFFGFMSELWDSFWHGGKKAAGEALEEKMSMSVEDLKLITDYTHALAAGEIPTHLIIPVTVPEKEMLAILKARE